MKQVGSPEQNTSPVRLEILARIATFGSWKALREIIEQSAPTERSWLQDQLYSLANVLYATDPVSMREMKQIFGKELPALARSLSSKQFKTALLLTHDLAATSVTAYAFTNLFNAIKSASFLPEEQFAAGCELAFCQFEHGLNPTTTLDYGLGNAARALSTEQFSSALIIATCLAQNRMDAANVLGYDLPAAARVLSATQFQECVSLVLDLADKHIPPMESLRNGIPAIIRAGCDAEQVTACFALGSRLAQQRIDPGYVFQFGIPAVASASPAKQHFHANLPRLEKLVIQLTRHQANIKDILEYSLEDASRQLSPSLFAEALEVAARLAEERMHPNIHPGLVALTQQAVVLKQHFTGYLPLRHEAVTHVEDANPSAPFHSEVWQGKVVTDHPAWVELAPSGNPLGTFTGQFIPLEGLTRLLSQRSWLYNRFADAAVKARALQQISEVRAFLSGIIEQLHQCALVDVAAIQSITLVGSYPWVLTPNDINLCFVLDGSQQAVRYSCEELVARGVVLSSPFTRLSIEVLGKETLLKVTEGRAQPHSLHLLCCQALVYGSALLAGSDPFDHTPVPVDALDTLLDALLADALQADWPELDGNLVRIRERRIWRRVEASALARFIPRPLCIPSNELWPLFTSTEDTGIIKSLAPMFSASFRSIAQLAAEGREQEALREFQARFEISFKVARDSLRAMHGRWGLEGVRREAAETILSACDIPLQIDDLLTASHAPADNSSLLIPARFTHTEQEQLLRPDPSSTPK